MSETKKELMLAVIDKEFVKAEEFFDKLMKPRIVDKIQDIKKRVVDDIFKL